MLALIGLPSHQNLRSRTTLVLITLRLKTPYEIVCGAKPQIPMSLRLGLCRNQQKLCCFEFCTDLPHHTHDQNSTKIALLQVLLCPQLSQAQLDQERDFKRIYSSTFKRCREQAARCHA